MGIKNENWQAAARDLGAHALELYLYFAANAEGFTLALSPAAIRNTIGMAPQTYRDQFVKLLQKGYLVDLGGNKFAFYEKPHAPRIASEHEKTARPSEDTKRISESALATTQTTSKTSWKRSDDEEGYYFGMEDGFRF